MLQPLTQLREIMVGSRLMFIPGILCEDARMILPQVENWGESEFYYRNVSDYYGSSDDDEGTDDDDNDYLDTESDEESWTSHESDGEEASSEEGYNFDEDRGPFGSIIVFLNQ